MVTYKGGNESQTSGNGWLSGRNQWVTGGRRADASEGEVKRQRSKVIPMRFTHARSAKT